MINASSLALWSTSSLLNVAGVFTAARAWNTRYQGKYGSLSWLLPCILVAAWLQSFFSDPALSRAVTSIQLPFFSSGTAINLLAFLALGLVFLLLRRAAFTRNANTLVPRSTPMLESIADANLRQSIESFLTAADAADVNSLAAIYAPDFVCIRVADEGGFASLTAEQMLSFLKHSVSSKSPGHIVKTRNTVIHHAEALSDTAVVVLTRVKDLGMGWEPLFYNLLWTRQNSLWRLSREFVHQRSVPNWQ